MTPIAAAAEDAGTSRLHRGFLALVAVYGIVAVLGLTGEHDWGDDWGQYVLHAKNLASGKPYADIGYLYNPDRPRIGPPSYPPGLPLLLAPVIAFAGLDLTAIKLPGALCLALAIPFVMRLHEPTIGRRAAIVGAGLVALHPAYWHLRQQVLSEAPFVLATVLVLWWAQRRGVERESAAREFLDGAIVGLLTSFALMIRSIGVALLPALVAYAWAQRRPWPWYAGLGAYFLGLVWLQSILLVAPPTYADQLSVPSLASVAARPGGYLPELAYLFPLPLGLGPVAAALLILLCAVGAWQLVGRVPAPPRFDTPGLPARVRALAGRVPLHLWYLGFYAAVLLVASEPEARLLVPLLPIVIPLAVHGAGLVLSSRLPRWPALSPALAVVVAAWFVGLALTSRFAPVRQMATCADCAEMFRFMREHTPPQSVVLFSKPRLMALLGERRSWAPSDGSQDQFERRAARMGLDLIVDGPRGSEFARRFPLPEGVKPRLEAAGAAVLFRNASFVVIRPGPAPRAP